MLNKNSELNRIKLIMKGEITDNESVRLTDLIDQLNAIKDILNTIEKRISKAKSPSLYYRIVGLSMNSPATIEIEPVAPPSKHDFSPVVIKDFVNGLKLVNSGKRPEGADYALLDAFKEMAGPLKHNLANLKIEAGNESINVSRDIDKYVDIIFGPDQIEYGSIRGKLEVLNIHAQKNSFYIYPIIGASKIKCHFSSNLLNNAIQGVNNFVKVFGEIHTKSNEKFPHFIEVNFIEILPKEDDLPSLLSLKGFAKNNENKSSTNHIHEVRDEW